MTGLILLLMFLSPLFVIMLFRWWMKRTTGYDPRGQMHHPMFRRDDIDFLKLPDFYGEETQKKRENKSTPHYDALVDAEWKALRASRLEDLPPEEENNEVQSLGDLLKQKDKD